MKRFLVTITLLITLVGSVFAKTTRVGSDEYRIKNTNVVATYRVISEEEALLTVDTLCKLRGIPLIVENNTVIDPEVAALTKKFEYVIAYVDYSYIVINMYDKNTDSYNTIIWY